MKFISFTFYKGYLYFIGFWISEIIRAVDDHILNKKIENDKELKQKDLFDLICLNISDIVAIFLVMYTYFNTSSKKEEKTQIKKISFKRELIYNDISLNINKTHLILISSLIDFIARCVFFIYSFSMKNKDDKVSSYKLRIDWLVSLDISFRAIFSRIILKTKLYNHHLVSIFICLFGFLCLIILNISIEINPFNSDYWIYVLFIFPKYILFPLSDVFNEIILRVNFIQPHTLMFLRGICEFPLMVILFFILLILNKEYIDIIIKGNTRNIIFQILLRLIFILLSSFRTFCLMKVLYLYNSQHISFLIIVFSFTNFINGLIKKDIDVYYYIVQFSSFIIIFFGTLIYNEIIIINACGLNDYTKESLLLREKIDKDQSLPCIEGINYIPKNADENNKNSYS